MRMIRTEHDLLMELIRVQEELEMIVDNTHQEVLDEYEDDINEVMEQLSTVMEQLPEEDV